MRLLLDTHTLVWFLEDDPALSVGARAAIETSDAPPLVSHASAWEMAIKLGSGKLRLPIPFQELFPARLRALGFEDLPVSLDHIKALLTLPSHHRDPFDRLLIAQASMGGFAIVTRDPEFPRYGVQTIW